MTSTTNKNTSNNQDNKRPKKVVKHSKKFVRTQTGCLQCRQKKKKCDGKRPVCLSCEKKGICCEFPANIRFFQYNSNTTTPDKASLSKAGSFGTIDTSSVIMKKSVSTPVKYELSEQTTKQFQFKNESLDSKSVPKKLTRSQSLSSQEFEPISFQSRSSSLSSIAPSLISDHSDTESIESKDTFAPPDLLSSELLDIITDSSARLKSITSEQEQFSSKYDPTEKALNLANDGESIGNILNNITIDLIKRSIYNLNYIDFETKLNSYYDHVQEPLQYQLSSEIKNELDYIEKNSSLNFKPDEFLSFDEEPKV